MGRRGCAGTVLTGLFFMRKRNLTFFMSIEQKSKKQVFRLFRYFLKGICRKIKNKICKNKQEKRNSFFQFYSLFTFLQKFFEDFFGKPIAIW